MGYWSVGLETTPERLREDVLAELRRPAACQGTTPDEAVPAVEAGLSALWESLLPQIGTPERIRVALRGTTAPDPAVLAVSVQEVR